MCDFDEALRAISKHSGFKRMNDEECIFYIREEATGDFRLVMANMVDLDGVGKRIHFWIDIDGKWKNDTARIMDILDYHPW